MVMEGLIRIQRSVLNHQFSDRPGSRRACSNRLFGLRPHLKPVGHLAADALFLEGRSIWALLRHARGRNILARSGFQGQRD
jgi:hypothetical protein